MSACILPLTAEELDILARRDSSRTDESDDASALLAFRQAAAPIPLPGIGIGLRRAGKRSYRLVREAESDEESLPELSHEDGSEGEEEDGNKERRRRELAETRMRRTQVPTKRLLTAQRRREQITQSSQPAEFAHLPPNHTIYRLLTAPGLQLPIPEGPLTGRDDEDDERPPESPSEPDTIRLTARDFDNPAQHTYNRRDDADQFTTSPEYTRQRLTSIPDTSLSRDSNAGDDPLIRAVRKLAVGPPSFIDHSTLRRPSLSADSMSQVSQVTLVV